MSDQPSRSPDLMRAETSVLLVVDLQTRLLAAQPRAAEVVWNTRRLLDAAAALGVPVAATEQVPDKLGPTAPPLAERLPERHAKQDFSSCGCDSILAEWRERGVRHVVVAGIETHVCVAQTVLDLVSEGFWPQVPIDAVASRRAIDHDAALRRLEASAATLTSTEAAMFEWCATAAHPAFRAISALAKESLPD